MSRKPGEQHIGDAQGLIALWLDEQSALDLANLLHSSDVGRKELLDAVERAYPPEDQM